MLSHVSAYTQDCGEGEEAAVPVTDAAGAARRPERFLQGVPVTRNLDVKENGRNVCFAPALREHELVRPRRALVEIVRKDTR